MTLLRLSRRTPLAVIAIGVGCHLGGCLATTKHLEEVEQGVTSRGAWTDERIGQLDARIDETRAENEALRVRMDDLADQISALGGEISGRLSELARSDEDVAAQVRRAAQSAARSADQIEEQREKDREELLARMNVIVEELVKENEELRKRIDSLESSAFVSGKMHKVRKGETIDTIAKQYGVTPSAIVEANGLSDANLIHVGEELLVPVSR